MKGILINNKNYQEYDVVLLSTDEPSPLMIRDTGRIRTLLFSKDLGFDYFDEKTNYRHINKQNLYILSPEKFIIGDWISDGIEVIKASPKVTDAQGLVNRRNWRKIIATTDESLKIIDYIGVECAIVDGDHKEAELLRKGVSLLQIPQSFIEYFVSEYNQGNIITKVLVEVVIENLQVYPKSGRDFQGNERYEDVITIKLNKSNEISILTEQKQETLFKNKEGINHLEWIHNRLVKVHGENPDYDYMIKLKEISENKLFDKKETIKFAIDFANHCMKKANLDVECLGEMADFQKYLK